MFCNQYIVREEFLYNCLVWEADKLDEFFQDILENKEYSLIERDFNQVCLPGL